MNILVVDDENRVRAVTRRLVQRAIPASIQAEATGVRDAIACLERHAYDAVVCDFDMMDGTGADVLAWIAANRPQLARSFVCFTGRGDVAAIAGITRVIEKGCFAEEFARELRAHLAMAEPAGKM